MAGKVIDTFVNAYVSASQHAARTHLVHDILLAAAAHEELHGSASSWTVASVTVRLIWAARARARM